MYGSALRATTDFQVIYRYDCREDKSRCPEIGETGPCGPFAAASTPARNQSSDAVLIVNGELQVHSKTAQQDYKDVAPYCFQRHSIRPGITGLAQINECRGSTAVAAAAISRANYDLEYIERWLLWLEIKII
jgi:Bacterial sugar transferase